MPRIDHKLTLAILKVSQICNLNCTYCYVYNRGDSSWSTRPKFIQQEVVTQLAKRITEHCAKHELKSFSVEFHGGEPLLIGLDRMRGILHELCESCQAVNIHFLLQTNGLLLTREWLELFDEYNVSFGISLDGPPHLADQYRVDHAGKGSTQALLDNIQALRNTTSLYDKLSPGFLCVINPSSNGAEMVRWLAEQGIESFDFLLPNGTYENLPDNWVGTDSYQTFLIDAFNEWYRLGDQAPRIRKFEYMIAGFMGVKPNLDSLGGDLKGLCVVETDGTIGVSDVARMCGGEFSADKINIFSHELDQHQQAYNLDFIQDVCDKCKSCEYLASCGGGYLPHRHDGTSFDNPSIYCDALYALSKNIYEVLRYELPSNVWEIADLPSLVEAT